MIEKYGDIILSCIFIIISIIYYFETLKIRILEISRYGAQLNPKITALLLILISIGIFIGNIKKIKIMNPDIKQDKKELKINSIKVILTILAIFLYIFLLEKIGFIITTVLYLFIQLNIFHKDSKKMILYLSISIITSFLIYYIFLKYFSLMLPRGILG